MFRPSKIFFRVHFSYTFLFQKYFVTRTSAYSDSVLPEEYPKRMVSIISSDDIIIRIFVELDVAFRWLVLRCLNSAVDTQLHSHSMCSS